MQRMRRTGSLSRAVLEGEGGIEPWAADERVDGRQAAPELQMACAQAPRLLSYYIFGFFICAF